MKNLSVEMVMALGKMLIELNKKTWFQMFIGQLQGLFDCCTVKATVKICFLKSTS